MTEITETDLVNNININSGNPDILNQCSASGETFDTFIDSVENDPDNSFSITWSNWDNLLSYIKLHLGSSVNNIEFTDEEIINIIDEHVLPEFSKYNPLLRYYVMYEFQNIISRSPALVFQFKNFKYKILNVNRLIRKPTVMDITQYYNLQQTSGDLTDMLIAQNSFSATKDFISQDTWRFFSPDKLQMVRGSNNYGSAMDFICELNCVHKDPSTIDPDQYNLFRDLSLATVFIAIGRIRKKFNSFNTPQSTIDINADEIFQEGMQLRDKTIQELEDLPPDNYVYFIN
jgi:hypothetical protein